jgi:hypothetical protein
MSRRIIPIQVARAIAKLEENWSLVQRLVRAGVRRDSNAQQDNLVINKI